MYLLKNVYVINCISDRTFIFKHILIQINAYASSKEIGNNPSNPKQRPNAMFVTSGNGWAASSSSMLEPSRSLTE